MLGHDSFNRYNHRSTFHAEPDLTKVMDYPGQDYFDKFAVTDLTITPERTLEAARDKGFHFKVAPNRQVTVNITGPGSGAQTVKATLGAGDSIRRSGVNDKTIVNIGGVETTYAGADERYFINFTNPLDVTPTGTDGTTDADSTSDSGDDAADTTDDLTATATDVSKVSDTESKFPTKLVAIGGIILIGGVAVTKMRKRGI